MSDRWPRILVACLLVLHGALALGAGRTICLPLSVISVPVDSTRPHHDHAPGHGSHLHHHGHTSHHHPVVWSAQDTEQAPDHVHLPIPDVDFLALPSLLSHPIPIARPTIVDPFRAPRSLHSGSDLRSRAVPDGMLRSDQITARATTRLLM